MVIIFKSSKLGLISWNADGVRNKIHELLELAVSDLSVDVIALCETKLTSNIAIKTPGFNCYRSDKNQNGRGQGVAILIKSNIQHSIIVVPSMKNLEAIAIKIHLSGREVIIVSAYQSPNLPLVHADLDNLFSLGSNVLICGDFNANHDYWNSSYCNTRGRSLFRHMLFNNYFIYAPSKPTQLNYRADLNPTTPDLILASRTDLINDLEEITALSSNHLPIFVRLGGEVALCPKSNYYRYDKTDWKKFRSVLDSDIELNAKPLISRPDIDDAISKFHKSIISARDAEVPTGVFQDSPCRLPYYIKRLIRYKNNLRRQEQKLPRGVLKRHLRNLINKLQVSVRYYITKHHDKVWNNKLAKVNNVNSDLWRITRSLNPKSVIIPPLKKADGTLASSCIDQANELANAFYSNMSLTLGWRSNPNIESEVGKSRDVVDNYPGNILEHPVTPHEVRSVLKKLKNRKSPGEDEIHNLLLKNISQKALVLLTKIFNGCLTICYYPSCWKTAKVIALKKPGKDIAIPSNYRPISLLPSAGKVFEKIIFKRLQKHADHLIINEQFGFRASHSTVQQLARVAEHVAHHLNVKQSTGMFLLDIEKAFDTVWHDGLLHKLIGLGIPLSLVKLVQSYLRDRNFRVHIGSSKSSLYPIPAGVPQGSILGPVLFILYINDVPVQTRTDLACFADDTASYTSSSDVDLIIDRLQLSLDALHGFFNTWKLKLNSSKTEAILFTRKRLPPDRNLKIDDHLIPWSNSVRYLGVILDTKLNWTKHVMNVRVKGAKALGSLGPIMNRASKLSPNTKLLVYTALVRPILTYACPVWSSTCLTNYDILQVIQNRALKIAFNTKFKTNLKNLHSSINFPLLIQFIYKLTHKFYNNNKHNKNHLISNLCKTTIRDLHYIDRYGTYRLPHHYMLFPPDQSIEPGE